MSPNTSMKATYAWRLPLFFHAQPTETLPTLANSLKNHPHVSTKVCKPLNVLYGTQTCNRIIREDVEMSKLNFNLFAGDRDQTAKLYSLSLHWCHVWPWYHMGLLWISSSVGCTFHCTLFKRNKGVLGTYGHCWPIKVTRQSDSRYAITLQENVRESACRGLLWSIRFSVLAT